MSQDEAADRSAPLRCPACKGAMATVTHDNIAFDRCDACGGLWFDLLEHRHLRDVGADPSAIDVKPAAAIKSADEQLHAPLRDCPRCHVQMTRLKDTDRRDVIYDYCSICNGTFFDAGEFRRYASHGFVSGLLGKLGLS